MSQVEIKRDGPVAVVRLARPPVNAISADLAEELREAFESCADPGVRAVVVTGEPHFAAGADIKGFLETIEAGTEEKSAPALVAAIAALEGLDKPTIAAVRGFALGGGLELAMGADFRYLSTDARVGQPEISLGLIPGAGGTQRLSRIVGLQRAKELIYSGRQVSADEAVKIGLADKVIEPERLMEVALDDAAAWAERATLGIAAARRALLGGFGRPLEEGMRIEAAEFDRVFATEDAAEGIRAFVEKRAARFTGK